MRYGHKRKGQVILEGVLLWVIIAIVLIGMAVFFQRAIRGRMFSTANQVGEQFTTGQFYSTESRFSSSRDEAVGTDGNLEFDPKSGGTAADFEATWSNSTIREKLPDEIANLPTNIGTTTPSAIGGKVAYVGAEVQSEDFVTGKSGGQSDLLGKATLGTHGLMDSGVLSKAKLFDEGDHKSQ